MDLYAKMIIVFIHSLNSCTVLQGKIDNLDILLMYKEQLVKIT